MRTIPMIVFMTTIVAAAPAMADVTLNCTSYSKEYDFKVTVGDRAARVDVVRAEPVGRDFYLKKDQSITLSLEPWSSADWMILSGVVQGEQTLGLNVSRQQLQSESPRMHLSISRLYSSLEELSVQVDCSR